MKTVIETEALRKSYRRIRGGTITALDGLDLSVPEGGVFGFLGPNGAGKTTAIRCLLGLIHPTSGTAKVLGKPTPKRLPEAIDDVGAIVETPALFPNFSGRRNLRVLAKMRGIGNQRVDEVLETVGLTDRADQTVKGYSLGMRQRLGLAATLLKDPRLLILDEPANGLDPAGIRAMRDLIRQLGNEGRTVFLSSHLLGEIEQTCDRVALLTKGRCIASGSVKDILNLSASKASYLVGVPNLQAGGDALHAAGFEVSLAGAQLQVTATDTDAARITETLARAGIWLTELRPRAASLEDVFLELTTGLEQGAGK